ncbi:MAG: AsmA family protein [Flavobacteriaceae bacterium]|nr:AsmA family protein [Flavobacteriaceae bacterium]
MRKIVLVLVFGLLLLVGLLACFLMYLSANLKELVVLEMNKKLTAKVEVAAIETAIWNSFPQVLLVFKDVTIENPKGMNQGELLKLKRVALRFNFWDIVNSRYSISEVAIQGGQISLMTDANKQDNFRIWKSDSITSGSDLTLNLKLIVAKEVEISYMNIPDRQRYDFTAKNVELSGLFSSKEYTLDIGGDVHLNSIVSGQATLIQNLPLSIKSSLKVDNEKGSFQIDKSNLQLNGLEFEAEGKLVYENSTWGIDTKIKGKKMNIPDLLGLLPFDWVEDLKEFKSTGQVYFDIEISGLFTENRTPDVRCNFGIRNGTLKKPGIALPLEQISMEGNFQYLNSAGTKISELLLSNVAGKMRGSSFKGSLELKNLEDPVLKLNGTGDFDLQDVFGFLDLPSVNTAEGKGYLNILLESKLAYFGKREHLTKIKADGKATLQNGSLKYTDGTLLKDLELHMTFNPKTLEISNCTGVLGQSDFAISGRATNWEGWLLASDTLDLIAKFESKKFVWENRNRNADTTPFDWPQRVTANLDARVKKFTFGNFTTENSVGTVNLTPEKMELKQVKMDVCGGSFLLEKMEMKGGSDKYVVAAKMDIHRVDVSRLFSAFDDFGQQTLTHKHLKGLMDAKNLELLAVLDKHFQPVLDKVYLRTDLEIADGELNGFEPILALSRFIDVKELQHLKFDRLSNQIELKNSMVYIPKMDIHSNAMNLKVQGTHSFDNYMDYHIELKLKQLILKTRKQKKEDAFGEYEDENHKEKGMTLYIGLKGKLGILKISYDRKEARKGLTIEAKEEKMELKALMKKEFGELKDTKLNPTDTTTEEKIIWED